MLYGILGMEIYGEVMGIQPRHLPAFTKLVRKLCRACIRMYLPYKKRFARRKMRYVIGI